MHSSLYQKASLSSLFEFKLILSVGVKVTSSINVGINKPVSMIV